MASSTKLSRILLLRSGSNEAALGEAWLTEAGYDLVLLSDRNQALGEIVAGDYQLLLFIVGAQPKSEDLAFCKELMGRFAYFPILQIYQPDTPKAARLAAGIFHWRKCKPSRYKSFLLAVKRLIYLGNLRRRLLEREYLYERLEALWQNVDTTQAQSVIARCCELWAELTECENVVWLSADSAELALGAQASGGESAQQLSSQLSTNFILKPLHPSANLTRLAALVRNVEQLHQRASVQASPQTRPVIKLEQHRLWLVAAHNPASVNERLGYFFLVQPKFEPPDLGRVIRALEERIFAVVSLDRARQLAYLDDLTELYNQRFLPLLLNQEMSRASREGRKFSILFLDVDYFKWVNDNNGHLVGSQLLVQVADVLRQCTRAYDTVFRYGGDEFVVVLPNASTEGAREVAERIRSQIEISTFVAGSAKIHLTVSIGIATYPDHAVNVQQVLQLADEAMYYGKNTSRNVVYIAS